MRARAKKGFAVAGVVTVHRVRRHASYPTAVRVVTGYFHLDRDCATPVGGLTREATIKFHLCRSMVKLCGMRKGKRYRMTIEEEKEVA